MILDSSVLLAIVFRESGHEALVESLAAQDTNGIGTPTLAETGIVLRARLGDSAEGILERMLDEFAIQEIPFGELHWREAVHAFRKYGKGRQATGLNFGDCLAYAAARLTGEPLLYVGSDFAETDVNS
ncbi:MAG: type II toxin-antitoxin system VapC family toxin [Gemmatimonadota bacterium]